MNKYNGNVGKKFYEDGKAMAFPGNTVICHIPKDSPQYQYLIEFQKKLKSSPFASHFSFLPPSSFHMTVFEGVCDRIRKPNCWTNKLPIDAPLEDVDQLFIQEWNQIKKPDHFVVRPKNFYAFGTIGFRYQPIDEVMEKKMRGFRDILAEKFGLRFWNHDSYHFHTTFGYLITKLSLLEQIKMAFWIRKMNQELLSHYGTLTTNEPELTFFTDMTSFDPTRADVRQNVQE